MCQNWEESLSLIEQDRAVRLAGNVVDDLHDLKTRFLAGQLTTTEWNHDNHIRLGLYLVWLHGNGAFYAFRTGVNRTNETLGLGSRFHYTVTFAYLMLFGQVIAAQPDTPILDLINDVLVSPLADPQLMLQFYSSALLRSNEARKRYIRPDLMPALDIQFIQLVEA